MSILSQWYEKANGWDWTGLSIALSKGPLISRMPPYLWGFTLRKNSNFTNIERCNMANKSATTCQNMQQWTWERWKMRTTSAQKHISRQCNIPQISMQEKEMAACTFGPGLHQTSALDMIYMHVNYTHACLLVQKRKKERTQSQSSTCKWHKVSSCFQLDRSMWSLRDAWHA